MGTHNNTTHTARTNVSKVRRILAGTTTLLLASAGIALASSSDFSTMTTGQSVNGQQGWTVEDSFGNGPLEAGKAAPFDEVVTDDGTGNAVWRVSNAVTYSEYAFQPFSPASPQVAGETGAGLYNDFGTDNTHPTSPPDVGGTASTNLFHVGFRFRSVTGATQPGLAMSISPAAKQSSWRMAYLTITDTGSGFDLGTYETGTVGDPWGTGQSMTVASGLSYGDWHTVDLYMDFVDGLSGTGSSAVGNDVVTIVVDGTQAFTGTSWETYVHSNNPAGLSSGDQVQAVDSATFRLAGTAAPATSGAGLYFDDVVIDNAQPVVNPTSKNDCKKGGWVDFGFRNQGQCVRYVNTGKDSR